MAAAVPEHAPARLTVLSGPSGVGKGTVVAEVRRRHPEVWVSVSATTRRPRPGEVDGVHYHFVTDTEFDRLIAEDGLLEWAEYAGNRYGTPAAPVRERLAAGAPALLEIELQGARQVRARDADAQLVFLAPPSWSPCSAWAWPGLRRSWSGSRSPRPAGCPGWVPTSAGPPRPSPAARRSPPSRSSPRADP